MSRVSDPTATPDASRERQAKIAVLRALQLGDLLCSVPALRALRGRFPTAELTLIGLPWARAFAERFSAYVDRFVEFPGWPRLPEREPRIGAIPEFLRAMQAERFDLAVQLHGSGSIVNEIIALLGARRAAGFYRPGDHRPDPDGFIAWPESGLELRRLLALTEHLGARHPSVHLEFPLNRHDHAAFRALAAPYELTGSRFVVIHPGASVPERRWPADRFAAVVDTLADRGFRVVLTGSAGECGLTREVSAAATCRPIDLAGKTDLGTLGVLLSRASLLVCNDTGVSHVADGLGTPSVVISTGDNPARWSPVDRRRHRVLCRDEGVSVEEVAAAAGELLHDLREPFEFWRLQTA